MKNPETAVKSFFLLKEIARLLQDGYEAECDLKYHFTGGVGHRIEIIIEPPSDNKNTTPQPDESLQISASRDK